MLNSHLRRIVQRSMAFKSPPEVLFRNIIRNGNLAVSSHPVSTEPQSTFKAAVVQELGKPVVIQTIPRLTPKDDEVIVEVDATAINFADILKSLGQYQEKPALPFVPGVELCGRVAEVGSNVKRLKVGQKVIGLSSSSVGGFAEYCAMEERAAFPVPDSVPSIVGASILISYGTAMMTLTQAVKVQIGETVLVTGAAGATGMAMMDIAINVLGANVIAVCGGVEKCELVKRRGASHAIDYNKENLRERIKEITKGKGVSVVVDQVGGDTFMQCLKSISVNGRIATIGYASGKIPSIPANLILLKHCSVHGVFWGNTSRTDPPAFFKSIKDTMDAFQAGKISPYCGQSFPLEQVNEAFKAVLTRKTTGKAVISLKPNAKM